MGKIKVTIEIPSGYVLVQTGEGKWEQRKKETPPKTWEEFCETHPIEGDKDCYISAIGDIITELHNPEERALRHPVTHRTTLPNRETAEAFIALIQLIQLRNFYNGDWKPDWADSGSWKYNIESSSDTIICSMSKTDSRVLAFRTIDLRDQFFKNFRDLIEIAKPLI